MKIKQNLWKVSCFSMGIGQWGNTKLQNIEIQKYRNTKVQNIEIQRIQKYTPHCHCGRKYPGSSRAIVKYKLQKYKKLKYKIQKCKNTFWGKYLGSPRAAEKEETEQSAEFAHHWMAIGHSTLWPLPVTIFWKRISQKRTETQRIQNIKIQHSKIQRNRITYHVPQNHKQPLSLSNKKDE